MKFCCVTPCLNSQAYIEETMLSVITQSAFKSKNAFLHYIVQDGHSSDNTIAIVSKIVNQYSSENIKIECFSETDTGMYDAVAKGFQKISDGDIYSYINAGDYYSNHAFEIMAEIVSKNKNVHFITGAACAYNNQSHLVYFNVFQYEREFLKRGLHGISLPVVQQESTFWTIEMQKKIDFNQLKSYRFAGDFFLWKTFSEYTQLYSVYAWIGGFKVHPNQLSSQFFGEYWQEFKNIALTPSIFYRFLAFFYRLIFLLPTNVRVELGKKIFVYDFSVQEYTLSKGWKKLFCKSLRRVFRI